METPKNNIGAIIKESRTRKDLTQEKLAELIGKNQQDINRYENNGNLPGIDVWKLICKVLDIPLDVYFLGSNAPEEITIVSDSKKQIYGVEEDDSQFELVKLIQKEEEFINEMGLTKLLKYVPKMSEERRKLFIQIVKTFLKN